MNNNRFFYSLFVFLFITSFTLPALSQEKVFNAKTFTLENGLQVVLIENHRAPIVTHMVWYKVGGADEPAGKSGLAHMFEHLMFKGSENVAPGEFSERVRALGGNDNAFTSYDYTAYFQSIAAEHLEEMMRMEADRMQGLIIPEDEFASEQKVVMEERRQRTDNDPRSRFYEQLGYSLFPHHPYGIPLIGWMNEIEALSREDMFEFYGQWYAPNNAILIVSGAITEEELKTLAEKYYGPLQRNPALDQPRERPEMAAFQGDYTVRYEHPRIQQTQVIRMMRVPSSRQNKEDALALQILEDILGGGPTTRLYQSLVVEQNLASNAGMNVSNSSYDTGRAFLYATPLANISPETLNEALLSEIRKVIQDGVTEEEISESKNRMQAEAIFARDSVTGPAMIIGRALTSGISLEDVETWPQDINTITKEQIDVVAKKYLDPDQKDNLVITGYLLPKAQKEPKE